ncbi:hypothetical protein [Falsiroseomonas sp.]|uniref:hypothetical protein n=1 Tax=Falsiroseomonas sp. TaxID=2870721 RepID=UPI003565834D
MSYAAPKKMKYGRSAIVCLAADLNRAATSRNVKRLLAGDDADDVTLFLAGAPVNLEAFFSVVVDGLPNRLIIVAHGNAGSTILADGTTLNARRYAPEELAGLVWQWTGGYRIGTVSLDACYSGGNKGNGVEGNFDTWTVQPGQSFAFAFAAFMGQVGQVTARTDWGTTHYLASHGEGGRAEGDMPSYNSVAGRYHALWDKIIITPNAAARRNNRVDPSPTIQTKGTPGAMPPQPV